MKTTSTLIAAVTVALFSGHAMALTKAEYEAGKDRIKAEYKADKEAWRGHFGDMASALLIVLMARRNTPDLYEIMQVMGADRVRVRIAAGAGWL